MKRIGYYGPAAVLLLCALCLSAFAEESPSPFRPGDHVTYGHYPQTASGTDSTSIEWLVLKVEGNKALLLSRWGLDARAYHHDMDLLEATDYPTWKKSDIRAWLNGEFLNAAFSAEEQQGIVTATVTTADNDAWVALAKKMNWNHDPVRGGADTQDKVFLLSLEEAMEYGGCSTPEDFYNQGTEKLQAVPTDYAVARGAYQSDSIMLNGKGCCRWWLRSPGVYSYDADDVYCDGSLQNYYVCYGDEAVRPAFWLNLDSMIP